MVGIGALAQIGSAVYFGILREGGAEPIIVDVLPAVLALVSVAIIGPRGARAVM